jgi:hypothetical protein
MCPPLQPAPEELAPRHFPLSASPAGRVLSPCCCTTSPTSMTGFLQLLCTTRCDVTQRLPSNGHGLPMQWHRAALAGAVSCWRSVVAGRSGSRPNGHIGTACLRSRPRTGPCSGWEAPAGGRQGGRGDAGGGKGRVHFLYSEHYPTGRAAPDSDRVGGARAGGWRTHISRRRAWTYGCRGTRR